MEKLTPYPRIIAHRCGGALAPENSLPGLDIAARIGCAGVEFDVMLSADGVPFLIHDETLDRTTTRQGFVAQLSAAELATADCGAPRHKAFAGTRIPTLDQALAKLNELGLWANIEIKPATGHNTATGETIARRLLTGWNRKGVVSSFSLPALAAARALAADLPMALLFDTLPDDWSEHMARLNASAIHLNAAQVSTATAQQLAGMRWACYTVNDRTEAQRLFDWGCSAIFTDRPDLFQDFSSNR